MRVENTLRTTVLRIAVAVVVFVPVSCTVRTPTPEAPPPGSEDQESPLPEIALIGGAHDVWPFSFGFDADRNLVESTFGTPVSSNSQFAGSSGSTARVVSWEYPGLSLTFFLDEATQTEQLLSARVVSPAVALRGGLAIDMSTEEAFALLGEPGLRADDVAVYFYNSTTIELTIRYDRVIEIGLSRAMP